ncbi:MAG: signal peptidase II [Ignavibacteria bacterium]
MRVLYFTFVVVVLDQLTKLFVKGIKLPFLNLPGMEYGQSIDVFGSFFRITFVENPGMAFGIDVGDTSKLFLSLFSLVASIGIIIYLYKVKDKSLTMRFALALVLGGAVGNLIDRSFYGIIYDYAPLFYGRVVDFFDVEFFDFSLFGRVYDRWPIFNIADASVTIGVFILVFFNKRIDKENREFEDDTDDGESISEEEALIAEKLAEDNTQVTEDDKDNIRKENTV